jgi:predicted RNase H-like HicB family nuclease
VKVYKLPYVVIPPNTGENDEDDKYIAEIPLLPGCRAWGDTPAQAVEYLHSVARAFIEIHREYGWPLPPEVESLLVDETSDESSQLFVAV